MHVRLYGFAGSSHSHNPHSHTPHSHTPHSHTPHSDNPHTHTPHANTESSGQGLCDKLGIDASVDNLFYEVDGGSQGYDIDKRTTSSAYDCSRLCKDKRGRKAFCYGFRWSPASKKCYINLANPQVVPLQATEDGDFIYCQKSKCATTSHALFWMTPQQKIWLCRDEQQKIWLCRDERAISQWETQAGRGRAVAPKLDHHAALHFSHVHAV